MPRSIAIVGQPRFAAILRFSIVPGSIVKFMGQRPDNLYNQEPSNSDRRVVFGFEGIADPSNIVVIEPVHRTFVTVCFLTAVVESGGEAAGFRLLELKLKLCAAGIAEGAKALELGVESRLVFGVEVGAGAAKFIAHGINRDGD